MGFDEPTHVSLEQSRLRVFRRGSAHGDCSSLTVVSTRLHQLGCRILNQMWRFSNHQSRCRYSCSARGPQSPIHYVPQQGHSFRPSHALCSPPLCLRGTPHSSFPVQSEERWVRSYHTQSSPMLFRDGNNMESECWTCYESVKFQPWGRLVISLIRVTLRHESCPASHGLESRTLIYGAAVGNCRSGSEEAVVLIMTLPRRRNFAISTSQVHNILTMSCRRSKYLQSARSALTIDSVAALLWTKKFSNKIIAEALDRLKGRTLRPHTLDALNMKFTSVIAIIATAATFVGAVPFETNAERLARGLPPLPPARRASGVEAAKPKPSPTPGCSTGEVKCCNDLKKKEDAAVGLLLGLLGIVLGPVVGLIGLHCSDPILGLGGPKCSSQTVCCTNNKFNGLINIGCSPINIGL